MTLPATKDCIVLKAPSMQFSITPDAVLPVVKCEVEATAAVTLLTKGKQGSVLDEADRAVRILPRHIGSADRRGV